MSFLLLTSFSEIFSYILYGLLAILILLVMITVHEFGHYIVGKLFHFGIEEFAIGFGPKIYSKEKKNGEIFSIRALPLGGFCSFKGEDSDDNDPSAFNNKKPYQRILVLIAGAFMNYLLALLIIILMFSVYGQNTFKVNKTIDSDQNNIYNEYVLQNGDIIIKANGKRIYLTTDLMDALSEKKSGDVVDFLIRRNGEDITQKVAISQNADFSSLEDTNTLLKALGVKEMSTVGVRFGIFRTIGNSVQYSGRLAGTIFTVIRQLFNGQLGIKSMGGTVTTITVTTKMIKTGGFYYLLYISSFIGINLAVFNLLPIPALDGSRVVFCLIEWIRRKPLNKNVEAFIHSLGFVILMLFAVFVDLQQCF